MKSKYKKWHNKHIRSKWTSDEVSDGSFLGWNAALIAVNRMINRRNKEFEGNWQHEDIEFLIEDIKDMIEK